MRNPYAGLVPVPMRGESAPQSHRPREHGTIKPEFFFKIRDASLQSRTLSHVMAVTPSRVQPLVDDAGDDDESRQAKRQAVEVFKLTGLSHEDVRNLSNDFSVLKQISVIDDLPPDVIDQIAINLDGKSINPMLSTCRAWRAHGSSPEFWEVLCKAQYPWLPHMSACMPQPQPPLRQLYFRQALPRKASRKATTSLSDYSYVMGIFGEKNAPPLVAKNGQLGDLRIDGRSAVDLWGLGPHGFVDLPAWASKIITDFRTNDAARDHGLPHENDSAAWMDSDGRRLASMLRVLICITRPDGKSSCLYDGFVSRGPSMNSMAITSCEYKTVNIFWLTFEKTGLLLADRFTRGRYKGLKLQPVLALRTRDAFEPYDQPELYLQFTMPSTNSDDSILATDADLLRYFKNFAPFGVPANQ